MFELNYIGGVNSTSVKGKISIMAQDEQSAIVKAMRRLRLKFKKSGLWLEIVKVTYVI